MNLIKRCVVILLPILFFSHHVCGGLILAEGESFTFEFQNIDVAGFEFSSTPLYFANVTLGSFLDSGESFSFSVYEDSSGDLPIRTSINSEEVHGLFSSVTMFTNSLSSAPWQDLQGVFKVEAIQGSIEIDSIRAATLIGDQYYEQTFSIPEPSSALLLVIGSGGLILYRRTKRERASIQMRRN